MKRFGVKIASAIAATVLLAACGGGAASRSAAPPDAGSQASSGPVAATAAALATPPGGQTMAAAAVDRPAPDFTLTDQFGAAVSLSSFRGKVVLLAFIDSQCTGVCPMTTEALVGAMERLGSAAKDVQLIAVDANPQATAVADVRTYSELHGVLHDWLFLTASPAVLEKVWKSYGIFEQTQAGKVIHTSAVYAIDRSGQERAVYLTSQLFSDVGAEAIGFARMAAQLLGPQVQISTQGGIGGQPPQGPSTDTILPSATASQGTVELKPGSAHLVLFFASWVPGARADLETLDAYRKVALASGLPAPVAVDVKPVEPTAFGLSPLVSGLDVPVAIDPSGAVADGWGVQADLPWISLSSASGKLIWGHDGALPLPQLVAGVKAALSR